MLQQDFTSSVYRLLLGLFYTPPPLPSLTITSFVFSGTTGTTGAQPTVQVTDSDTTSINWTLWQSASTTDASYTPLTTGTISSPTGTDSVSYLFPVTVGRWYYYTMAALNSEGTTSRDTTHLWNYVPPAAPTLTYVTQGFNDPGSTSAMPFVQYDVTGSTVTVTWELYETVTEPPTLVDSGTVIGYPTGRVTTTSSATTIPLALYNFVVTATNAGGSDTFTTTRMVNESV